MPRFSLSLGYFFTEEPLVHRFALAAAAGFEAVELFWPGDVDAQQLRAAATEAGIAVAQFNLNEGDYAAGDRGFACRPEHRDWWRTELQRGLDLAQVFETGLINVLPGKVDPGVDRDLFLDCFVDNLRWAAPHARSAGVRLVIEPLTHLTHPFQLCQRTVDVIEVLDLVADDAVALQYDVFHAQSSEGNIVATLREQIHRIGHVQIADVPTRSAPGTGELNFGYILDELDRTGYRGFVGLEYLAPPAPVGAFDWLKGFRDGQR